MRMIASAFKAAFAAQRANLEIRELMDLSDAALARRGISRQDVVKSVASGRWIA